MPDLTSAQCTVLEPVLPKGWSWENPAWMSPLPQLDDGLPGLPPEPSHLTHKDDSTLEMVSTRLVHVIAESLDGRRPLHQLDTWFDTDSVNLIHARHLFQPRVRVASVRVQPVSATAAEVSVRLTTPARDHAAALRVICQDQRCYGTGLVMG
jgi:hypothetical protein